MQKGGSCRFSTPRVQSGGSSDAFLDKSLKKEKLRRLSSVGILCEMNKLSPSMATTSASKKAKLPEKFLNHCNTINYASTPRRRRSALVKRKHESPKPCAPALPDSRIKIDGFECRSKESTKKHKTIVNEYEDSKQSLITKDEEEAAEALFSLAQTCTEPSAMQRVPPNGKNVSQKRCLVHVNICHFIKALQTTESVNVTSDANPRIINHEHYSDGFNDHLSTNLSTATIEQEYYHSHWSTMLKQQRYLGCYQNWQNQRRDATGLLSGSWIEVFGSKDGLNTQQGKWGLKGDLSFVDERQMLELSL